MKGIFILPPVFIMAVFINTADAHEWLCRAMPGDQYGYECPTTECQLVSGDFHGLQLGMSLPDAYSAFCRAAEIGAFDRSALAEYEIPNSDYEKQVVLTPDFCVAKSEIGRLIGWIASAETPEESPLITRLLILSDGEKLTNIAREVRDAECYWETGL